MKEQPDLSIIIVSWNTRDLLAQCLASVVAQMASPAVEIFVVDNASTDDSVAMVQQSYPGVELIVNEQNVGFAQANNQAIAQSKGRYVLLLNPDTEVGPGALETLLTFMEEHPEAGAAGARLLNADGSLQNSCNPLPSLPREIWRLFHLDFFYAYALYDMARWDQSRARAVDSVQGACLILRHEALRQVGPLDTNYFMYTEEVDLCYRLRREGWAIYWVPQAPVLHYGGQSSQQAASDMFLRLYQSKLLYFRKHHGRVAAQAYKLILISATLVRLSLTPFAWLGQPSSRNRRFALARYYGRLLRTLPAM